jgi:hypothetical protein
MSLAKTIRTAAEISRKFGSRGRMDLMERERDSPLGRGEEVPASESGAGKRAGRRILCCRASVAKCHSQQGATWHQQCQQISF